MQRLWDQEKINRWARKTFGASDSLSIAVRANREMSELLTALLNEQKAEIRSECADVMIILLQVAQTEGFDLLDEVERKMAINVTRKWTKTKNGDFQHA